MCQSIINRGTGYETLPWQQWCWYLCWKGRDHAQFFVLISILQLNILTGTFLLDSCSNTFQNLLWFVHGQGQKGKQKHITKKFIRLQNHCLLLTMTKANINLGQRKLFCWASPDTPNPTASCSAFQAIFVSSEVVVLDLLSVLLSALFLGIPCSKINKDYDITLRGSTSRYQAYLHFLRSNSASHNNNWSLK